MCGYPRIWPGYGPAVSISSKEWVRCACMRAEKGASRPGLRLTRRRYMKAVVFHGVGDIRLDDVPEPKIQEPTDAIVRLTSSAICGTDLHMIRGTLAGMKEGTILGHEGVGVVEEVGPQVRNLSAGPHGDTDPAQTRHGGHRGVRSIRPEATRLDQGRTAPLESC